jgi:hypothetical protein
MGGPWDGVIWFGGGFVGETSIGFVIIEYLVGSHCF